ncbi:MAG: peptide transporter, partial [Delftia sp.]|nr:peptide transporter [Delftia sp.]
QIFAGGVGSVRGFPESSVGGDKGMVWRNEWALQRPPQILGGQIRYEPYLFVDAARLSTVADSRSHALASAGGGLRIAFAGGFAELIAGKPLRTPSEMPKPGWRVNASLAYQF